ncbi:hypothetical protein GF325_04935 [Candidatus Bathyarchaeota archaeon]|nr:hypothetical protein [Candidatus Bathyarchaeota archaeon]
MVIVNALLSFTSFIAAYNAVFLAQNQIDDSMFIIDVDNGLSDPTPYLQLGQVNFTNEGLFDFDDFSVKFRVYDETDTLLLDFQDFIGKIDAGGILSRMIVINESNGYINPGVNFLLVDWSNVSGFLEIRGDYAFSLFNFNLTITNISGWIM